MKIGRAFIHGTTLTTLDMFIDWIKRWKFNHGVNTQILSLEYSKLIKIYDFLEGYLIYDSLNIYKFYFK